MTETQAGLSQILWKIFEWLFLLLSNFFFFVVVFGWWVSFFFFWQQVCLTSKSPLSWRLLFPFPPYEIFLQGFLFGFGLFCFPMQFIYNEKECWWCSCSPQGFGPRTPPLTPRGAGILSECHSTQKASICICTAKVDGVEQRENWRVPHLLCAPWLLWPMHGNTAGRYKLTGMPVLVLRTSTCLLVRRDTCSATQWKWNRFPLQGLGKPEVALFAN